MSLEFNKVVEQVFQMGKMLEELDFDLSDQLERAKARFYAVSDLSAVWERIEWVRGPDISGYRGAAPVALPNAEPINRIVSAPPPPATATIIAADGSQIYPDEQSAVHYYLINIGLFVYHHGAARTPEQVTIPKLYYHKAYVHDRYGRVIRNRTVDDRRTVAEMKALGAEAWNRQRRGEAQPIIALYDNQLLYVPSANIRKDEDLAGDYLAAFTHLADAGAILGGYIDNPFRSKRFIQLLYLTSLNSLEEARAKQLDLARAGDLEGLSDQQFFDAVLDDGQRSAIMVQNSPQNEMFRQRGPNYEVAFFYLKVANGYQSKVVRVDLPVWVARQPHAVDALHSLLLEQCQMQGRNPYPYALTRADELAYISGRDKAELERLINVQVRRVKEELALKSITAKTRGKELARSEKRIFEL